MKTINLLRLSVAVILMVCLASCHKNTQGRLVPKDAAVVMVIDGQALSSKLSWDEIKQNPLFQKALADSSTSSAVKSVLNNPDSSGADIKSDIIFFVEKDSVGGYVAVEGSVKDSALFRNYCTHIMKGGTITQKDGITYISNYPGCIGWNKDKFVMISDAPALGGMDAYSRRMKADSIDVSASRDNSATCSAVFALDKDNSLATNNKFTDLFKEPGDIRFWINAGTLYSKMFAAGAMAMLNLDDYYKDNVTTAALSFDNGKISINTKSYMNAKLLALYKQYVSGKINEDMLQRLPGKDVAAAMAVNFNPAIIKEVLKQLNMDGIANEQLKQANLTTDDIINAFKGDIVYGATDFKMQEDSATGEPNEDAPYRRVQETPSGNFIFAASIGDKDAFNKVFNVAKALLKGNGMMDSAGNFPYSFDNNGTYFVVSNTKENTAKYLGSNTNNFDFISKINGVPFGGYANIHSLLLAFEGMKRDSSGEASYDASLKMWDNIYIKAGGLDGDITNGSIEINLLDKSTNSLTQLNQYVAKLSEIYQKEQSKIEAERIQYEKENPALYAPDTSLVAPPTAPSN